MEAQQFSRRVYDGAPVDNIYKISAVKFTPFKDTDKLRLCDVSSLNEYETGCHIHDRCFGHMCRTPNNIILPPQSMSMRTLKIANEYNAASKLAFKNDKDGYIEKLTSTNLTKRGTYRVIMSTPVAGSARLIATPQYEFGRKYLAISKNLASRMRVCKKVYDDKMNPCGRYVETSLNEYDWVILVRPPSLHFGNTQPIRIRFWDNECIGIHPETFSALHGDFDGDEAHIYPVYDVNSIAECEAWDILPLKSFQLGRIKFKELRDNLGMDDYKMYDDDDSNAKFVEYTTLSAKQLKDGEYKLALGNYSRNKDVHVEQMCTRFNLTSTADSFVTESIRGMEDVKRQRISQGTLGDMTRISKIVASCFFRPDTGSLYVKTSEDSVLLNDDGIKDIGSPSVRAMSSICAVAQQAALDAHRAEAKDYISHDFISDLVLGCRRKVHISPTCEYTFIEFSAVGIEKKILSNMVRICDPKWIFSDDGNTIRALCKPSSINANIGKYIKSAYNPEVLSKVVEDKRTKVCANGIRIICNYYSINISAVEINDISYMYSYSVPLSNDPITSRSGLTARKLAWIETFEATDYKKLPDIESNFETPDTTTAAMFISNFNNLKLKYN